ncbi:branched-chain amino acid ABC transporter permease [Actinophytocola sp.]|uniref:branched-chain amino acid ABC transporter permease n=1 Tax=Actinophytocola sp. TaxID=1872138 RepID=UPI003D6A6F74
MTTPRSDVTEDTASAVSEDTTPARRGGLPRGARLLRTVPPTAWLLVLIGLACVDATLLDRSSLYVFVFNTALLACIGAVALNVLMGTTGQVSVGNAAFLAVGAFSSVIANRAGFGFVAELGFAMLVGAVVGFVVGLPASRIRGLYFALATLAAQFIVLFLAQQYQQRVSRDGFIMPVFYQDLGYLPGLRAWTWTLFGVVVLVCLLCAALMYGKSGRALRLIRDHEGAAPAMGIPVSRYRLSIFVVTSMLIAVQGSLTAHMIGSVTTDQFTFALAVSYIVMILIGGLDSIPGALFGAFFVTFLPQYLPAAVAGMTGLDGIRENGPQLALIVYGVLVMIFITSAPRGVAGWARHVPALLSRVSGTGRSHDGDDQRGVGRR